MEKANHVYYGNLQLLHKLQHLIDEAPYSHRMCLKSLNRCNTRPLFSGTHNTVDIAIYERANHERRAHYIGLGQCENVWVCPYCAARKITEYREKITAIIKHWREQGYTAHMVTFTIPHYIDQPAQQVIENLKSAYKTFTLHHAYSWRRSAKSPGTISAYEVKYNDWNGWHFHLHVLYIMPSSQSARFTSDKFEEHWRECWQKIIAPLRRYNTSETSLKISKQEIINGDYIAKELAKTRSSQTTKNKHAHSRDAFDLLESDNPKDNQLYLELCLATHGRSRITIGTKLYRSISHEELKKNATNQEQTDIISTHLVASFTYKDWFEIIEHERTNDIPHRVNILNAAETAELDGVISYCDEHRLPRPHAPTHKLKNLQNVTQQSFTDDEIVVFEAT